MERLRGRGGGRRSRGIRRRGRRSWNVWATEIHASFFHIILMAERLLTMKKRGQMRVRLPQETRAIELESPAVRASNFLESLQFDLRTSPAQDLGNTSQL